jgi:membrane fusion protein (multidrug efflux system)
MSLARDLEADRPALGGSIDAEVAREPPSFWRRWRWPMMVAGPAVILAVAAWFMLTSGRFESTDDAYVQRDKVPVSASIAGRVIEIDVVENQPVKAGQVLFKLDPADELAAAHRSEAELAAARLQVTTLRKAYDQQRIVLASDEKTADYTAREATRQKALVAAGVASRQQAEDAAHAAQVAADQVRLARQAVATALANLGGSLTRVEAYPGVLQAQAAREASSLNLAHTVVVAPVDGVVTRVSQLQVGAYVNAAQTVFWLLSGRPWTEANFKENQLRKMRVGQPARIQVDAYGGTAFAGHVESFSPGAGGSFSPLPAQNATGNWVKVVQRLPVRIAFDRPPPPEAARDGLSAKVTVDVRRP